MKAIYKYTLPVKERFEIELPFNARILRVEDVDGLFYLWAIVNTKEDSPKETRYFEAYKPGQQIETNSDDLQYLGALKMFIGQELCLYVFENIAKRTQ